MVHKDISEGHKLKPRGRPFPKGNKQGKLKNDLLAPSGLESGDERGVIAPDPQSLNGGPLNEQNGIELQLSKEAVETVNKIIKESMDSQAEQVPAIEEDTKSLELIESIEFKNGENTLTIRFSKKHNRMYRIQVFLNNQTEVRPVTYTGANTGYAFWNLLKGALKK